MKVILISNSSISERTISGHNWGQSIITSVGLTAIINQVNDITGNTVYVIDVHCIFSDIKLQEQGGLIIYRHLLKKFKNCQHKLKVIFYSPISKENLVKLRPENYVLNLLPFVECKYEGDYFTTELENEILNNEKNGWPQFNNASENLLSGWALANKLILRTGNMPKKINTLSKDIIFVDDQQNEWKGVFYLLFNEKELCTLDNISGQEEYREKLINNWRGFMESVKNDVIDRHNISLILADLYLTENHEPSEWKDITRIKSISGFKFFSEIRNDYPAIPYMVHSSSNKASIYKFLDTNGVDDWLVKDIREDSSNDEKLRNYEDFKSTIEGFLAVDTYDRMKEIWKEIEIVEETMVGKFWNKHFDKEVDNLLRSSWIAIRRVLNREVFYEKQLTGLTEYYSDSFTSTAVCNNLGKVLELLRFSAFVDKAKTNPNPQSFLIELRHEASHSASYTDFSIRDAQLYFKLLFKCLRNEIKILNYDNYFHKIKEGKSWVVSPCPLFFLYIKFYNSVTNWDTMPVENALLKNRINELFFKSNVSIEFNNTFENNYKHKTLLTPGTNIKKNLFLIHDPQTFQFSISHINSQ